MEREVGEGIGMGNTCKPMAVSFQCMTKSTTIKKIIIIKKRNKPRCDNMDGPRVLSKSEKENYHMVSHVESKKQKQA